VANHRETALAAAGTAACAIPLAVALGSERFLGLIPCAFCLLERKPYYVGVIVGLVALLLPRRPARALLWVVVALLVVAAVASFVHVGVQWHWWPDPLPECRAPDFSGMTMAERLAAMPARPAKLCEDPDYLIPAIPISFPEMGVLYALAVCVGLAMWLSATRGRRLR
jgi:disulfide bond formation protein DsbB